MSMTSIVLVLSDVSHAVRSDVRPLAVVPSPARGARWQINLCMGTPCHQTEQKKAEKMDMVVIVTIPVAA